MLVDIRVNIKTIRDTMKGNPGKILVILMTLAFTCFFFLAKSLIKSEKS